MSGDDHFLQPDNDLSDEHYQPESAIDVKLYEFGRMLDDVLETWDDWNGCSATNFEKYRDAHQAARQRLLDAVSLLTTRAGATPLEPKPQGPSMAVDEGGRTVGSIPATGATLSDMTKDRT